ncbi:Fe-S cluster biogenesis protein NfuA [Lewinella marina]|uniref:NifU family protein n=1 Tax=Neolewinella marina TaxID=438751 RepID=A0A2G0CF07_9BACT|nr:NifU family protein [Neolewinella marina]NJB85762.1 Fe-S cluster biogenesis protein NfuA [Neolewinella marina]PHK98564.1 NifU family protein [Neolewinella marina]
MSQATTATKRPVLLYTEQTPNPETLKFVTNRMLYNGTAEFREEDFAREWSPLATELYDFPYVQKVYIANNYVTITKEFNYSWDDIMLTLKEFVKGFLEENKTVIKDGFAEAVAEIEAERGVGYEYTEDEAETVSQIKELIDTYVKPAVESDGGNIEFKSYRDGVVTVIMQGACSGCPSSTVTLKSGIEQMLKRMMPQVKEVQQEMG